MLEVQGLRKAFGDVKAVDGVSFTAGDGGITGLLGPNGAGKTTTLRMLYTLMRPDAGSIHIDGIDALERPLEARRRMGVALARGADVEQARDRARTAAGKVRVVNA